MTEVLLRVIEQDLRGLIHVGGPERISRWDTALAVADAYRYSVSGFTKTSYRSHPQASVMPQDCSYDISYLKRRVPELRIRPLVEEFREDAAAAVC